MRLLRTATACPARGTIPAAALDLRGPRCRKGRHLPAPDGGRHRMDRLPPQPSPPPPSVWLPVGVSVLILLSATALVTQRLGTLQSRLEATEGARAKQAADMHTRLEGVQTELSAIRQEL